MYVCICEAVTDTAIREAVVQRRATTVRTVRRMTGACSQCGKCAEGIRAVIQSCPGSKAPTAIRTAA